ncbi:hypothetical protein [Nocardioides alkalitolerans]|uniref:hypothetical protein n=1 Tax=Nocardioides alkalitolerans TaxID=281714 RepID=UPI000693EEF1|nr:hypothetical protein [Nocardioides alkalitolerans]
MLDLEVDEAVLGDDRVARRFWSHVMLVPGSSCVWWIGAISGRGHGRFWVRTKADGSDHVVIAHRFAYALAHNAAALAAAPMLTHRCDNPLCVNVDDLQVGDALSNGQEWATRRHRIGGPLRDVRGSYQRALDIREAIRRGADLEEVRRAGGPDADQRSLF